MNFPLGNQESGLGSPPQKKENITLNENENNLPIPERTIFTYCNSSFLADSTLKSSQDNLELPFHKIILCAASDYINNFFKFNDKLSDEKILVQVPEKIVSHFSQGNPKDCLALILKYCYANQDFQAIKQNVDLNNIFTLLSYAHCLRIKSLINILEGIISENFVNHENVMKVLNEAILYDLPKLKNRCLQEIVHDYENLKENNSFLDFNFEIFKGIVSSDDFEVTNEKEIVELVTQYILSRRNLQQSPIKVSQEPKKNSNDRYEQKSQEDNIQKRVEEKKEEEKKEEEKKEEEKKEEEKKEEEKKEEEKKEEEKKEEEKKEEEKKEEEKKDEEKKEEEKKEEEKKEEEKKEEEKKEEEKKEEEKKEEPKKFETIPEDAPESEQTQGPSSQRNELLKDWKNYITEQENKLLKSGLTPAQERELILCIRFSFLSHADLIAYTADPLIGKHQDLILEGLSVRLNTYENTAPGPIHINLNPRKSYSPSQNDNTELHSELPIQSEHPKENNRRYFDPLQSGKMNPIKEDVYSEHGNSQVNKNPFQMLDSKNINQIPQSQLDYFNNHLKTDTHSHTMYNNTNTQSQHDNNYINNQRPGIARSGPNVRPPQDPRIFGNYYKNFSLVSKPNPVFKYVFDFDENGALYYLGTKGKTCVYNNPGEIGIVQVFSSTLGKGNLNDFVGRQLVNLRTLNEENSFFGVDLGLDRFLIPTSYSIRNRNSNSHVMLCWNLEGSNDGVNFNVLDTRVFANNSNPSFHQSVEKQRKLLSQPGCTSTWGISKKVREKFPNGFRYFILKQIDKNSSGGYNLAISGFELYGESIGTGWIFN